MLTSTVDIENVDGTHTFSLNADTGGTSPFTPLNDFDVTIEDRSLATRYKVQTAGSWPTRSYDGAMTLHIEGSLFADNSTDYWTARQALMLALRGTPAADVTNTKRGTIYVTPVGATERWSADYGPLTFSAPVQANYVTGTDILITAVSFLPWFIGEDTGDLYWWS